MILQGRQIFSHLEGQESLPAKLYVKAINHRVIHPQEQQDCPICQGILKGLAPGFNQEGVFYTRQSLNIFDGTDPRDRLSYDEDLIQRIKLQREKRKPKPVQKRVNRGVQPLVIKLKINKNE